MACVKIYNLSTHAVPVTKGAEIIGVPTPAVVSMSPVDSARFATGGGDNKVIMWKLTNETKCGLKSLSILKDQDQKKPISCMEWSPNGQILAFASYDKCVRLWTQNCTYEPVAHETKFGDSDDFDFTFDEDWQLSCKLSERGDVVDLEWSYINNLDNPLLILTTATEFGLFSIYQIVENNGKNSENVNVKYANNNSENIEYRLLDFFDIATHSFVCGIAIDQMLSQCIAIQTTDRQLLVLMQKSNSNDSNDSNNSNCSNNSNKANKANKVGSDGYAYNLEMTSLNSRFYNEPLRLKHYPAQEILNTKEKEKGKEAKEDESGVMKGSSISKESFLFSNAFDTCVRPHWSPDSLFLATPGGAARDGDTSKAAIHIFYKNNLKEDVISFVLKKGEVSHFRCCKWNPKLFAIDNKESIEKNSICEVYKVQYYMILAAISKNNVFLFDTKTSSRAVFRWHDKKVGKFNDLSWNCDGTSLMVSDESGFLTCINFDSKDFGRCVDIESEYNSTK